MSQKVIVQTTNTEIKDILDGVIENTIKEMCVLTLYTFPICM